MVERRTSSASVTFGSYNLLDFYRLDTAEELQRYERVYDVVRGLDVDVLAIQELQGEHEDPVRRKVIAEKRLDQFAEAVRMRCRTASGQSVLGISKQGFHVALLWREGIQPVGEPHSYDGEFFHNLVKVYLDVGSRPVLHASYHAPFIGRNRRADEAESVHDAVARSEKHPPALIAADWNSVSADRVRETEEDFFSRNGTYYDVDPYADLPTYDSLIYQTRWTYDSTGNRYYTADREAGEVLSVGGLRDVAAELDAPWAPTVGHWPNDDSRCPRRFDAIRVSRHVVPALRSYRAEMTDLAHSASDHLPVVVEYQPQKILTS